MSRATGLLARCDPIRTSIYIPPLAPAPGCFLARRRAGPRVHRFLLTLAVRLGVRERCVAPIQADAWESGAFSQAVARCGRLKDATLTAVRRGGSVNNKKFNAFLNENQILFNRKSNDFCTN